MKLSVACGPGRTRCSKHKKSMPVETALNDHGSTNFWVAVLAAHIWSNLVLYVSIDGFSQFHAIVIFQGKAVRQSS